jgi:hypothetical protein
MFKDEDDFNYEVSNCRNIAIKTLSESNTSTLNRTNIVISAVKISKKCGRPPNVVSFDSKEVNATTLKAKQGRLKNSIISVLSPRCTEKRKHEKLSKAEMSHKAQKLE